MNSDGRSESTPAGSDAEPTQGEALVRKECIERFCNAWQSGTRPRLVDFLQQLPESQRQAGLRVLLTQDLLYRRMGGDVPQQSDYADLPAEYLEIVTAVVAVLSASSGAETTISEPCETELDPVRNGSVVQSPESQVPPQELRKKLSTRFVGSYEILSEIASGGMGVVYKARHSRLGRIAAIKLIKAGELANDDQIRRFHLEAQATAELDHPGIVQVYEVGQEDNQHYLAMAFIDGQTLWQMVKDSPLPPRQAARIMQQVAEAVHYAHCKGIIHRDLKPQNILVTKDGQPKVTDFGLAKRQAADSGLTGTGQILGTPSYMPPEQISANSSDVGPLADVYSLGATLYCLLTGRPPFQAATPLNTMLQVLEQDPVSPRSLSGGISSDLETICVKCLQKDWGRRYQSAMAFAEDLVRYQSGEPILARPVGQLERGWRWCRRNPVVSGAISLAAFLLFTVAIVSTLAYLRESQLAREKDDLIVKERAARKTATEQESLAIQRANEVESELYRSQLAEAAAEIAANDLASAGLALDRIPLSRRGNWEFKYLRRQAQGSPMEFYGHTDFVSALVFSSDCQRLYSSSADGTIKSWDVTTGKLRFTLDGHSAAITALALTTDDGQLASASNDKTVQIWNVNTGTLARTLSGHERYVKGVSFSYDGTRLASSSVDGIVKIWKPQTGELIRSVHRPDGSSNYDIQFSPDGSSLAVGSSDKVWLLQVSGGEDEGRMLSATGSVLAFNPDGSQLAIKSPDLSRVQIWDLASDRMVAESAPHLSQIQSIAFSPDGQTVASGAADRTVNVFHIKNRTVVRRFSCASGCSSVSYSPDGYLLATGTYDGTVQVWDVSSADPETLHGHTDRVGSLSIDAAGASLASASWDGTVRLWDIRSMIEERVYNGHKSGVEVVRFSPDGSILASDDGKDVKLWSRDSSAETMIFQPRMSNGEFSRDGEVLAFSPNGKLLATNGVQHEIYIWDISSHRRVRELHGHTGSVRSAVFSPSGEKLVTASNDRTVRIWDVESGLLERTLSGHSDYVWTVTSSHDGTRLASTSLDRTVKLWNPQTGDLLRNLRGHSSVVPTAAFCGREPRIATGSMDGTIRIWDVDSGESLLTLRSQKGYILSLCFTPDGSRLFSASDDASIRVWDTRLAFQRNVLIGHTDKVVSVEFSDDGSRLVSTDDSDRVLVWKLPGGELATEESPPSDDKLLDESPDPNVQAIPISNSVLLLRRNVDYDPWAESILRRQRGLLKWQADDALLAEGKEEWFAAAFHLGSILSRQPDNADARERYDRAIQKLTESGGAVPRFSTGRRNAN